MSQYENLSDENISRLESICAEFEQKIRQNANSSIEDAVDSAPRELKEVLTQELISIEINWMNDSGLQPSKQKYVDRFPSFKDFVEKAFRDASNNQVKSGDSTDHGTSDNDQESRTQRADIDATMDAENYQVSLEPGNTLIFSGSQDEGPFDVSQDLGSDESSGTTDFKVAEKKVEFDVSNKEKTNSKTGVNSSSTLKEGNSEDSKGVLVPVYSNDKKYLIESEIDRGGMGVVLKVRDLHLDRVLAMKVVRGQKPEEERPSQTPSTDRLARFVREASVTSRLDHPGVVPVHEMGKDEQGRLFFTMKLVRGKTLSKVVKEFKAGDSSWTRARILEVLVRVCDTLAFAHSNGVIHRDLKPANIMVGDFGEAYVMDWGLAKILSGDKSKPDETDELADRTLEAQYGGQTETLDGSIMGTPHYMPPEQALGMPRDLDEKCDIYSLGAMLYEILTGQKPYAEHKGAIKVLKAVCGERPIAIREIEPKAPNELVAIAEKAMQKEKEDRYATAGDLADDIRAYLDNRVVSAYRTGTLAQFEKWAYRNRTLLGITLTLSFVGLAMFAYFQADKYQTEHKNFQQVDALAKKLQDSYSDLSSKKDELDKKQGELEQALEDEKAAKNRLWGKTLVQSSEKILASGGDTTLAAILGEQAISNYEFETIESKSALYAVAEQLSERHSLIGHSGSVERVKFSPDERLLATCSYDGTCIVWDVESGRQKSLIVNRQNDRIKSVEFSESGDQLLIAGGYGSVSTWETKTGNRIAAFQVGVVGGRKGFPLVVISAHFLKDENKIIAVMKNGNVFLVDLQKGEVLSQQVFQVEERRSVSEAQLSPDKSRLVTGCDGGRITLYEIGESSLSIVFESESVAKRNAVKVKSIDFSSDGKLFAASMQTPAGESFHPLSIRESETGNTWKTVELGNGIASSQFLPGGNKLVLGVSQAESSYLSVWDCEQDKQVAKSIAIENPARLLKLSRDGSSVASVRGAGGLSVWRICKEESEMFSIELVQDLNGHLPAKRTICIDVTSNGGLIASGSQDQTARIWQLDERRVVPNLGMAKWLEGRVGKFYFRFRPDGKRMLTLNRDNRSGTLWSLPDLKKLAQLRFDESGAKNARFSANCFWSFSPDGKFIFPRLNQTNYWSGQPTMATLSNRLLVCPIPPTTQFITTTSLKKFVSSHKKWRRFLT